MTVAPRRLVHRGFVDAHGVLLARTPDEAEARRRALALWAPGARVYSLGARYVLLFAAPRRMRAETAPGAVLVRHADAPHLVATAPLTPAERAALLAQGASPDGLVCVESGEARALPLGPSDLVDPAPWIDLDALHLHAVTSLGAPPPPVVRDAPDTAPRTVRPSQARPLADALQQALATLATSGDVATARAAQALADGSAGAWSSEVRVATETVDAPGTAPSPARPRGWWSRLRGWVQRLLGVRPLRGLLGSPQSRGLQSMIARLRDGDLDAALRLGIPLHDATPDVGPNAPAPLPLSDSPLTPRARLDIRLAPATHRTAAGGPSLHTLLTSLYRDAAQRLEAEGRFDEAAFVLAELLRVPGEAVALLDRHGRHTLAAEIADKADLAPSLRVRLWLRAGDPRRALQQLRTSHCYPEALQSLADDGPGRDALRRSWARHLAALGDYAAARTVAGTLDDLAPEVEAWGDALLALGGPVGARVLAERLSLHPDRWEALRRHVDALAGADGAEGCRRRSVFVTATSGLPHTPALRAAARRLVRPQARAAARSGDPDDRQTLQRLVDLAGDDALRVDVPFWPTFARTPLHARPEALVHTLDAADTGPSPVWDAARLPDGSLLLALGEAGTRLRSPDGAERTWADTPCHRLVLSDRGDRALLLAARGTSWHLARLVLPDGPPSFWGVCTLDAFADTYDGDVWMVGQAGEVIALDALADGLRALHGPALMPRTDGARVRCIARNTREVVAVRSLQRAERWRWRTPGWSLIERLPEAPAAVAVAVTPGSATVRCRAESLWFLDRGASQPPLDLPCAAGAKLSIDAFALPWVALVETAPGLVTVSAWLESARRPVVSLRLVGARQARARLHDGELIACDDRGRVLVVDLQSGALRVDLRV